MNLHPNRFTVVLDACVLGGALRRNMLLSLAKAGLFRPGWSPQILNETQKAISRIIRNATDGLPQRQEIERAFPEALVTGHEVFEKSFALPDPNDNHVLAAAIAASSSIIVTENISDFPAEILATHRIEARTADDFIADAVDLHPSDAIHAFKQMRHRFTRPALHMQTLILKAEAQSLTQVATFMTKNRALL